VEAVKMADESNIRALDATDAVQIIEAIQEWINGLDILDGHLWLEYVEDADGLGYCIKSNGGSIIEEDICGDFTAEVPFIISYCTNAVPDGVGAICKPLNDLSAWFKANGTAGLDIGDRRSPERIITTKGPTDMTGLDEKGNTTFFAAYQLTYDEEVL